VYNATSKNTWIRSLSLISWNRPVKPWMSLVFRSLGLWHAIPRVQCLLVALRRGRSVFVFRSAALRTYILVTGTRFAEIHPGTGPGRVQRWNYATQKKFRNTLDFHIIL
jgi:hypothetical protein